MDDVTVSTVRPTKGSPVPSSAKRWTVMVFMGADGVAGSVSLADAAAADLVEMGLVGSNPNLNIFVQLRQGGTSRRGRIEAPAEPLAVPVLNEQLSEADSGVEGGRALHDFIDWAIRQCGQQWYDSNHYKMLVLWGHAFDFAIGRAPLPDGRIDSIDFVALSDVLKSLQEGNPPILNSKIDIVGFDACDVATVEVACQLEPFAGFLLGSQIGIPIPGWPYNLILERLHSPLDDGMLPVELGSYIVRRFCESYPAEKPVSLTLLDLQRSSDLQAHLTTFAGILRNAIEDPDAQDGLAALFWRSQTDPGRPYVDAADLCLNLIRESDDAFVIAAARALGNFLLSPAPPQANQTETEGGTEAARPFVVEHGRNAGEAARLNGISLYAPHVEPSYPFEQVRYLYDLFEVSKNTQWSNVVHAIASRA